MLPFRRRLAETGLAAIFEFGFVLAGGDSLDGPPPAPDPVPSDHAWLGKRSRREYLAVSGSAGRPPYSGHQRVQSSLAVRPPTTSLLSRSAPTVGSGGFS